MSRRALLGTVSIVIAAIVVLTLPAVAAQPGKGGGGGNGGGKPTTTTTSTSSTSTTSTSTSTSSTTTTSTPPSDPNLRVVIEGETTAVDPGNFADDTVCVVAACPPPPHQDVVVHNDGDRAVSGVIVTIGSDVRVRNGSALKYVVPAAGTCSNDWQHWTYTCDLGTIPAQTSVTVRLTYELYGTIFWPAPAGARIQGPAVADVSTTASVGGSVASASMRIVQGPGFGLPPIT